MAVKTDVKIRSLFTRLFGSKYDVYRLLQIYMDVGVSSLRFKYPATLKKNLLQI